MPLLVAGLLLATAAAAALGACGDDSGGGSQSSLDLTIGDLVPRTGDLSAFGSPGRKAADLAVKQIQAAAKEAGVDHAVEVVDGDDGSNSKTGVEAARKLVDAENANCLAGGGAPTTIPIARSVAISGEIPMISPASTEDAVTGRRTTVSSAGPLHPTASRARRCRMSSRKLWVAPRARPSTSAPAVIPTAPASPTRSARRGRGRGPGRGTGDL